MTSFNCNVRLAPTGEGRTEKLIFNNQETGAEKVREKHNNKNMHIQKTILVQ